ncbi:peptidase inhibitor 16-like [Thalassophryne amazonica]|uniref:peptidase inhibitor 16-like n=1 Tax=Thalassophryne amazonica TaxID=390379 RepID=UPI001471841D|nr:peptidase inhibitor 16-like [Thalassophryne amazonica]
MHQWSRSEMQTGASVPVMSCSSGTRTGSGITLWAWLLLGVLVVPGTWSFLVEQEEELLVELHNYYRGQVTPAASAMLPLKWDPALKLIAEGYAAKCIWNHNPELEEIGENLFASTGPLDLREALEKWFLERLDYEYHNNSCDDDRMCGHYTQMVWAGSHRVGCASHDCNSMEGLDWDKTSFLVCNYYPAGNYEGERPYEEGDSCSRCPEDMQKCENNLCVADTVGEEEEEEEEEGGTVTASTFSTSFQPEEKEEEDKADPSQPLLQHVPSAAPNVLTISSSSGKSETSPPTAQPVPGRPRPNLPTLSWKKIEKEAAWEMPAKMNQDEKLQTSCGSVLSSSLVLAGMTGVLILRL